MFGKIKDRLKNMFSKTEDVVDENPDEIIEEVVEEKPKKKPAKKSPPKKKEPKEEVVLDKDEEKEKAKPTPKKKEKKVEKTKEVIEKEKPQEVEQEPKEEVEDIIEETKEESSEIVPVEPEEEKPKKKGLFGGMFKKKEEVEVDPKEESEPEEEIEEVALDKGEKKESEGFLKKTFKKVAAKKITDEDFDKIWIELEIFLLEINIAFEIVQKIEVALRERLIDNSFSRFSLSKAIREVLVKEVEEVMNSREGDFLQSIKDHKGEEPLKILVLGVNGTGKTTTIAKIVHFLKENNLTCVVAAADTFRAAAIEQLEEHSKKLDFKLIQHKGGSDPAAVAYDAIEHAKAKKLDIVLIDTAGRMPNNANLMTELLKIRKVSDAQMAIFIGDSISGNDLIDQIDLFNKGVEIDGVVLTKVDTDERPGSVVTTAYSIEKPIYFLGVGQTYDDLVKFDAKHIAEQLFSTDDDEE